MNNQKEKQDQWCITDLFYMSKSYEQILADHILIKKIKYTLEQAGMSRYSDGCTFEDLIKEAYFQCGIICKPICTCFGDYEQFFIKKERRYFKEYDYLNKRTVACIVHLLLSTRKEIPEGVGSVVDAIKESCFDWTMLGRLPQNPFVSLLNPEKHKHEIDFGVRAKSLSNIYLWNKVNWYDLGLDDYPNIYDIEKGFDTPENYCRRLADSINSIMKCLDFEDEKEQLDLLDRIGKTIHDNIGCTYDDCEFYNDRPNKCKCEENYLALEPVYFNPLRAKVIEELKGNVMTKVKAENKYKNKKGVLDETQREGYFGSNIFLSENLEKAELARIIYSLCKLKCFVVKGKEAKSPDKDVFKAFGDFLHVDFSNYHNDMKIKETSLDKHLSVFSRMSDVFEKIYNDKLEEKK